MSIPATGHIARTETGHDIVIERTLHAPIDDVWNSIVEPERMNRWIGTWEGEARPGKRVHFTMTAEGDDAQPEEVLIHQCEAPRVLDVETYQLGSSWHLRIELSENGGATTLVFRQSVDLEDEGLASYGVGWEYYLDRLAAVHSGSEFSSWDSYYPAQTDHWKEEARRVSTSVD